MTYFSISVYLPVSSIDFITLLKQNENESMKTGVAELAEVDGPFVKIRLKGRFWHERSLVLARLGNYLKERIPVSLVHFNLVTFFIYGYNNGGNGCFQEILEVDIEDEKQLDDSPENF